MGKGVFAALAGLIAAGITVALLASAPAPSPTCASGHALRGPRINTLIPPGNSSVSEYVESVPTARGGCPSAALRFVTDARAIPRSTERALLALGPDGGATVALARRTGPAGSAGSVTGLPVVTGNRKASRRAVNAAAGGGSSSLGAVADAFGGSSGGGGLGLLLPIVLIVCLLGTVGMVFLRHRRRGED